MRVKILLVDDHEIVRLGLRHVILRGEDMEIVAEACDGDSALQAVKQFLPDVVLMDVRLQDRDGVEVSRLILQQFPKTKIVIVSAFDDREVIDRAIQAGVKGFVLKINTAEEIVRAIRTVMAGRIYLCAEITTPLVAGYRKQLGAETVETCSRLTDREYAVLKLTAEGLRTKEIAAQLNIKLRTAETYRARLMVKLGCRSNVELTRYAIREGIAPL